MIIKISVRELRGLMASGSAPSMRGALQVASHAGDGKTKQFVSTGRAFRAGSDHDVDRVGAYCSSPMPEGFMGGFPHGCPAAAFGRRFSGAFDSWLGAFDCVLRQLPGCDSGGRMLEVESCAVTDTDAVVRVFRLEGGVRCGGGPLIEDRVRLKPWCVPGSDCGAYVDGVVSDEVDALVRGLGSALGFDDGQMARVRALVALEERPPRSCGTQETHGTHDVAGPGHNFGSRSADVQDYDIDDDRHLEGVSEEGGDEGEKTEPARRIRRG